MMLKKRTFIIGTLFAGLCFASIFIKHDFSPGLLSDVQTESPDENLKTASPNEENPHSLSFNARALPEVLSQTSLSETDLDGSFSVDITGNLIATLATRKRFDYFLSLIGEIDLDEINRLVYINIDSELSGPAAEDAKKLYRDYLSYKRGLISEENLVPIVGIAQMQSRLNQLHSMRVDSLGQETAESFFREEEMLDQYHINRLSISAQKHLTKEEKAAIQAELLYQLPEHLADIIRRKQTNHQVQNAIAELDTQALTPAELFQARSEIVGEQAATNLQKLDLKRQAWADRMHTYSSERNKIYSNPGLNQDDKDMLNQQLLESMFSRAEIRRVRALTGRSSG